AFPCIRKSRPSRWVKQTLPWIGFVLAGLRALLSWPLNQQEPPDLTQIPVLCHFHAFVALDDRELTLSVGMKSLKNALSKAPRTAGIESPHWQKGFFGARHLKVMRPGFREAVPGMSDCVGGNQFLLQTLQRGAA
ncbi:MAG TPA: hypothetical protein VIT23_09410, partial [Terrimicrobiaceae bacterium]